MKKKEKKNEIKEKVLDVFFRSRLEAISAGSEMC